MYTYLIDDKAEGYADTAEAALDEIKRVFGRKGEIWETRATEDPSQLIVYTRRVGSDHCEPRGYIFVQWAYLRDKLDSPKRRRKLDKRWERTDPEGFHGRE